MVVLAAIVIGKRSQYKTFKTIGVQTYGDFEVLDLPDFAISMTQKHQFDAVLGDTRGGAAVDVTHLNLIEKPVSLVPRAGQVQQGIQWRHVVI